MPPISERLAQSVPPRDERGDHHQREAPQVPHRERDLEHAVERTRERIEERVEGAFGRLQEVRVRGRDGDHDRGEHESHPVAGQAAVGPFVGMTEDAPTRALVRGSPAAHAADPSLARCGAHS
jgi:hypothetical protein